MARRINCEQISPILSAYLDGELSKAEREAVEWHLRECERCRSELRELERVKSFARQVEEVQPPISLRERIMARVAKEKECEVVRPLLTLYADGDISEADREKVEEHIAMCEDCKEELEGERKLKELLHSLPEVEAPRYLRQRIYAAIERRPIFLRRIAIGFTTLAAAASLVFFALPIHHPTTSPTTPAVAQRILPSREPITREVKPSPTAKRLALVVPQEKAKGTARRERAVVPPSTSQTSQERPAVVPQVTAEEVSQPQVSQAPATQPSEKPAQVETKQQEVKVAEHPQPAQETSQAEGIKVAVKPQTSVSELLKEATSSFQKPSLPSKIGERPDKSIVIGVARIEF
jgi:anti-sigma factor (TIGR02949 family)